MITINEITKNFGDVKALSSVSTVIGDGSIFGLIGSNGSGKSTLLRTICGIYKPDSGKILCNGQEIYENYELKQKIVYLSDEQYFAPAATLDDMRTLYRSVYREFDDQRYCKMTDLFGLDRTRKINTFSKGMQKQSSLLLGMSLRPKYLLCDETFDGIDPVMRQLVRRMIAEDVAESGLTAIISTHNLRELDDLTDHIALMHRGEVMLDRELDDMKLSIHKAQVAYGDEAPDFGGLEIISHHSSGKLHTITCRGSEQFVTDTLAATEPLYFEILPLTLEEIFISEMEDLGYDSDKIIS